METRQLQYLLSIAQEGSISKAAEKLYITQSALNQQLLKLERELGAALFHRGSHKLAPTYAGKVYLEGARQMLDIRNETYKKIHDISNLKRGEIAIAFTPERGSIMFSEVYPKFHALYPEITFQIYEERVKRMEQLLDRKEVTIAFLAYTKQNPLYEYHYTKVERMVLGLPVTHRLAHLAGERSWETLPPIDVALLRDEVFVILSQDTRMRDMIDALFAAAGIRPQVLFETARTQTAVNMVQRQICAAFFPQSYVDPALPIAYFSTDPPYTWGLTATTLKGVYLNQAELDFIHLTKMQYSW